MIRLFVALLLFSVNVKVNSQTDNSKYDKHLADSLGADDYGMKMYVLVILKTGNNKMDDKTIKDSLFRGHMQNIVRLASIGKLIVAGPLKKNDKEYEGIFILNVKTVEDAKLLLETDPAIRAKLLDTEIYQWYGSAALSEYLKVYDRVAKKKF